VASQLDTSDERTDALDVSARGRLARHLRGDGIEVGPGSNPFPVPPGATIRYVDRWAPDEARRLYPEVPEAEFPEPDVVIDFDVNGLDPFPTCSLDFVVASHVLEHLADPLGFLVDIHRVLRPGGVAIVLLPDRRRTFDSFRPPTLLSHLVEDHACGVTRVADDHVEEFLALADKGASFTTWPEDSSRDEFLEWHRLRSIHVHCWTEAEFHGVLLHTVVGLGLSWEIVERIELEHDGIEFGYLLRRSRFRSLWERLSSAPTPVGSAR
jgi:SAM-dependent methyltransferase